MKRKTLKPADAILWLVLLAATAITITGFSSGRAGALVNIITASGMKTVGLEVYQTFTVDGKDGEVTIEIRDGAAAIVESPCPHGLCKQQGYVSRVGQSVMCLPEGVKLVISDSTDTYDAVLH